MKKLLIISIAVFVSVMGWGQNPYAYDLRSSVESDGTALTLSYVLNADATDVKMYLLTKDNDGNFTQRVPNWEKADIPTTKSPNRQTPHKIQLTSADLPTEAKGVEISWELVVTGTSPSKPTIKTSVSASGARPTCAYGIAVNNNPNHGRFAQMFVTEAFPASKEETDGTHPKRSLWDFYKTFEDGKYWSANEQNFAKSNTIVEYTPLMEYVCAHHKFMHNGGRPSYFYRGSIGEDETKRWATHAINYEPNRVKVSEDGRMFVSSFHPQALCAVYEYVAAYDYYNVVDYDYKQDADYNKTDAEATPQNRYLTTNPLMFKRCIGMDVKGSGENLTILLCWMDANGNGSKAKIELWEYYLGAAERDGKYYVNKQGVTPNNYLDAFTEEYATVNGQKVWYQKKIGDYYDIDRVTYSIYGGLLYQGFTYKWNSALRGFVDVAYGENDDIWIKVDYGSNVSDPAHIIRMSTKKSSETGYFAPEKSTMAQNSDGNGYYGGSGIYVKNNKLYTGNGSAICVYEINANGTLGNEKKDWRLTNTSGTTKIGYWVTGFAEDYAGNLYAVTGGDANNHEAEKYVANVIGIAMPYSGTNTTISRQIFNISDPVSEMKYRPVDGKNQYEFTFNVKVPPTAVEIRFYDTKEKMLKGGDDYAFHYSAFTTIGKFNMSVTFDAVKGTITNKELEDTDENKNGILNLPPGEYYWCVCVNGIATPAPDEECFIPERISQDMNIDEMSVAVLDKHVDNGYMVDNIAIYRPMIANYFNTFSLPLTVDLASLPDGHPYKVEEGGATLLEFRGVSLIPVGGEKVLELQFDKTTTILQDKPYLFKPKENINMIISLDAPVPIKLGLTDYDPTRVQAHEVGYSFDDSNVENKATFCAMLPRLTLNPALEPDAIYLILVDGNRLAKVSARGEMLGLRGVFYLDHKLSAGTVAKIAERQPITTGLINFNGTQIDVNKFLQEGRVYIRVGDSLYTIDGQKVE